MIFKGLFFILSEVFIEAYIGIWCVTLCISGKWLNVALNNGQGNTHSSYVMRSDYSKRGIYHTEIIVLSLFIEN